MTIEVLQSDMEEEHPLPIKFVLNEPSCTGLSLQKEKSPTKGDFKTPVPSSCAMVRAVEVQYSLGTEFPSCIKTMHRSQVSSGFWLGLWLQALIANEIKTCKLTTTNEAFKTWDNSLKSFELLGMKVGFIRDKIHKLESELQEEVDALW